MTASSFSNLASQRIPSVCQIDGNQRVPHQDCTEGVQCCSSKFCDLGLGFLIGVWSGVVMQQQNILYLLMWSDMIHSSLRLCEENPKYWRAHRLTVPCKI
jgi:hypothetical protein